MGDYEPMNLGEIALAQCSNHLPLIISQMLASLTGDALRLLIFLLDTESPRDVNFWNRYIETKREFPDESFPHNDILAHLDILSNDDKRKLTTFSNNIILLSELRNKLWNKINRWVDVSLLISIPTTIGSFFNNSQLLKRYQTSLICFSSFFSAAKLFTCFKIRSYKEKRLAGIALKQLC